MKFWAAKKFPDEIRGSIEERFSDKIKLYSFVLHDSHYIEESRFQEDFIQYEFTISQDLINEATHRGIPIIFCPTNKIKFKLKE